jgi:hypothetical protein
VLILPPIGRALEDDEWMALVSFFGAAPDEYLFHVWLSGPPGGVPDSWHAETLDPISGDATEAIVAFSPSERSPVRIDRYRWEMLGILKDWPAPDEPGYTRPPWPAIRTFASAGKIGPSIKIGGAIATCQVRLYCGWFEGSAISAEMSWSGGPSLRWGLRGLSQPPKKAEWDEAKRTLRLLQHDPASGGRPRGWRKGRPWGRKKILAWYGEASEAYALDGKAPTLRDLAEAMGLKDAETARTRVEDAGLTWPPK